MERSRWQNHTGMRAVGWAKDARTCPSKCSSAKTTPRADGHTFVLPILRQGGLFFSLLLLTGGAAQAQIVPDATLPTNSVTTTNGDTITITGGTQSGSHLFHSFDEFSIATDQTALFDHSLDLETLITRVTGSSISTIEGLLETQGTTDFFLLNPNGIVFSDTAQLNVGGSFIVSTAESLLFDNGDSFSAVDPQAPPLLTVNTPVGLQYGSLPGAIVVTGPGHNLAIDDFTLEVIRSDRPDGLRVNDGETLALLGGPVTLTGGNLTAQNGRIILNAVTDKAMITLAPDSLGWSADVAVGTPAELVALTSASSLLTSGEGGGNVYIVGQFIDLLDGSTVLASTEADGTGQGVRIQATDELLLSGTQLDPTTEDLPFPSSILAEVTLDATGRGGDIALAAPFIRLEDGAQVSTTTFSQGPGGDIEVNAGEIEIADLDSGVYLNADFDATGQAGTLTMQADQLTVDGGGLISSTTFGLGKGGQLNIWVEDVLVRGGSLLLDVDEDGNEFVEVVSSSIVSEVHGEGDGGTIYIESDRVQVLDSGQISVSVFGPGSGGQIDIVAETVSVEGTAPSPYEDARSEIISTIQFESPDTGLPGTGLGGDINIQTTTLNVSAGARITSDTFSPSTQGQAGAITVNADLIQITGDNELNTGLFAAASGDADGNIGQNNAGNITLLTNALTIENGAQIAVVTIGPGDSGTLTINANTIDLDGSNSRGSSGLFASALLGTGRGGDIDITTNALSITDGATINASNFPSANSSLPAGQGPAGDIFINAPTLQLDNQGTITTSTNGGDKGNIFLTSDLISLSDRSSITTDAQSTDGGNIRINTRFLVGNGNSDITANAFEGGDGGSIRIATRRIFGLAFRDELTPGNDITVSSAFGTDGEVIIDLQGVDSTSDLGKLPSGVVDESDRVATGCPADQGANFIATGRGGLPDSLSQQLQAPLILQAFERSLDSSRPDPRVLREPWDLSPRPIRQPRAIAEAQGWYYAANGTVELTTHSTTAGDRRSHFVQPIACLRRTNA